MFMPCTNFRYLLQWALLLLCTAAMAQQEKQIEIIRAGSLEGYKSGGVEVRRLIGDVVFKQDETFMYCDSALFYEVTNSVDAYGSIRIEGPSTNLKGEFLHYDGQRKEALITGKKVIMTDGKMELTTTSILYDLASDIGSYSNGGRVTDRDNVLTSKKGYYHAASKMIFFKEDVVLKNPKYNLYSDTLRYFSTLSTTYFLGPTYIYSTQSDSSRMYCEFGWYNTATDRSCFQKNASVISGSSVLTGDSIQYDRRSKTGESWGNVALHDTLRQVIIRGDYARLNEKTGSTFVTGKAELVRIFTDDSLFLHADTLFAFQDSANIQKTYKAYRHVRMFKTDLQGQCDSMAYSNVDSTIWLYGLPILWAENYQLTGDTIGLIVKGDTMSRMLLFQSAFIAGKEDSVRFNQIKGKEMTGYFSDNRLSVIHVTGNGESVYYLRNKKKQLTGVNSASCSEMRIKMTGNKVGRINLLNKPDAILRPVKSVQPDDLKLKGFLWKAELRPLSKDDIFIWQDMK